MKNTKIKVITADEARALIADKTSGHPHIAAFAARMFDEIRAQAKIGKETLYLNLVDYSLHLNFSLSKAGYLYTMEGLEIYAENAGYSTRRICQNGEYLLRISWAEN